MPTPKKKLTLSRYLRYTYFRLVRLKFSTHQIALSFAIGAYIGIMPTLGVAMVITFFVCRLFSLSTVAGMLGTWVNNPWTMIPAYYWSYFLGCKIFSMTPLEGIHKLMVKTSDMSWADYFQVLCENAWNLVLPLMTGAVFVAFCFALISYIAVYFSVENYRKMRKTQKG